MRRQAVTAVMLLIVVAALILGAFVIRQRALDQRTDAAKTGSASTGVGGPLEGTTVWSRYRAALTAFDQAEKLPVKPVAAKLDAVANAQQALEQALQAGPSQRLRSQLLNLSALLLEMSASSDKPLADKQKEQASAFLQQAITLDPANSDAKFNHELLMQTSPQSTSKDKSQPKQQPKPKKPKSSRSKTRGTNPAPLGSGY